MSMEKKTRRSRSLFQKARTVAKFFIDMVLEPCTLFSILFTVDISLFLACCPAWSTVYFERALNLELKNFGFHCVAERSDVQLNDAIEFRALRLGFITSVQRFCAFFSYLLLKKENS